jgi:hypothetical protein
MGFPEKVLEVLEAELVTLPGVEVVVARSLNPTDPHGAVGIVVDEWVIDEVEMGPLGFEPVLSTWEFVIQHMVKVAKEEDGLRLHRETAERIRLMLYRDEAVGLAFRELENTVDGRREKPLRWQIKGQRFASNEISGNFVSLSVTEFSMSTETSNVV